MFVNGHGERGILQTLTAPGDAPEDKVSDRGSTPLASTKSNTIY